MYKIGKVTGEACRTEDRDETDIFPLPSTYLYSILLCALVPYAFILLSGTSRTGDFSGMWKYTLLTCLIQPIPLLLIRCCVVCRWRVLLYLVFCSSVLLCFVSAIVGVCWGGGSCDVFDVVAGLCSAEGSCGVTTHPLD